MNIRWSLIAGLVGAASTTATWASGEEPYVLSVHSAAGCPSEQQLHDDVVAQIEDAAGADGALIELHLGADGTGFAGELLTTDTAGRQGRRRIQGSACAEVGHALAFLAALAIDLGGRTEPEPELESSPATGAEPSPITPPIPLAASEGTVDEARTGHSRVSTGSTYTFSSIAFGEIRGGLGPDPRPGAALGLQVESVPRGIFAPALWAAIDGAESHISSPDGAADLSLLCARLLLCPLRFGVRTWAVRPCVGTELGAIYAVGSGPAEPRRTIEPWASFEGVLRTEWRITNGLFVDAEGGASLPLVRSRYFFEPAQTLYTVPAVAGRAGLGLGLHL